MACQDATSKSETAVVATLMGVPFWLRRSVSRSRRLGGTPRLPGLFASAEKMRARAPCVMGDPVEASSRVGQKGEIVGTDPALTAIEAAGRISRFSQVHTVSL